MKAPSLAKIYKLHTNVHNWTNIRTIISRKGSRGSSGSIVSDYGLDDRAIGIRSPAGAKDFSSSLCVQIGSGAHPASCTMGTGGPFPGGKARPGRDADHSPHLVSRSWMSRSYTSSPPSAFMACRGTALISRKISWVGDVAWIGEMWHGFKMSVEKPERRYYLVDQDWA
jgi:hypothetical protein